MFKNVVSTIARTNNSTVHTLFALAADCFRLAFKKPPLPQLFWLLLVVYSSNANALTTVTISDEVVRNNAAGRTAAAALDDAWVASHPNGVVRPDLFSATGTYSGSKLFNDIHLNAYQVDWQVGYIADFGPGLPSSTSFVDVNSSGSITKNQSNVIQAKAPSPYSTDYRLSTGFSGAGLNGIEIDFSNSPTTIKEVGMYIGDLESRANNGTLGRVIVFDEFGSLLADEPITYTGVVINGTNYQSVEPIGSPTGPLNNKLPKWGNDTTVFISIKSDQVIGRIVIHSGDDDHTFNNTGTVEQAGFIGFQIPNPQLAIDLEINKYVDDERPNIGQELTFTLVVTNNGSVAATNFSVNDILPAGFTYSPASMTGPGVYDDSNPSSLGLSWDIPSLSASASTSLTFRAVVEPPN